MPRGVYIRSPEYRESVRIQRTGTTLSAITRSKISQSGKHRYASNPCLRQAVSVALAGKSKTDSHKENLRQAHLGKKLSTEHRAKLSTSHRGTRLSSSHREALSKAQRESWEKGGRLNGFSQISQAKTAEKARLRTGQNHPRWVADRTKLAKKSEQRTTAAVTWSRAVRRRFPKCALSGCSYGECSGRLESHHIDPYKTGLATRFDVDNGITLCVRHHPRKQSEVESMAPVFKEIVANARRTKLQFIA